MLDALALLLLQHIFPRYDWNDGKRRCPSLEQNSAQGIFHYAEEADQ
jgi:hypothetical protein